MHLPRAYRSLSRPSSALEPSHPPHSYSDALLCMVSLNMSGIKVRNDVRSLVFLSIVEESSRSKPFIPHDHMRYCVHCLYECDVLVFFVLFVMYYVL
jgi:hypothetical protein